MCSHQAAYPNNASNEVQNDSAYLVNSFTARPRQATSSLWVPGALQTVSWRGSTQGA
jgi:hypothetical protein